MRLVTNLRENQDLNLSILLLNLSGIWPPAGDVIKSPLHKLLDAGIVLTVAFGVVSGVILLPLGAFGARDDLISVLECVGVSRVEIMTAVKLGTYYFRGDRVKELTSRMVSSKRRIMGDHPDDGKQKIANEVQKWINVLVVITVVTVVLCGLGHISRFPSLFVGRKHFARIWFPLDLYSSPTYELVFVFWAVTILVAVPALACADGFLGAIMLQIVCQFRLLRRDLSRLREDAVDSVARQHDQGEAQNQESCKKTPGGGDQGWESLSQGEEVDRDVVKTKETEVEEEMARRLGDCVRRYQDCARFVKEVESTLGPYLEVQLVVCVIPFMITTLLASVDPIIFEDILDVDERERRRADHLNAVLLYIGVVLPLCMEFAVFCYLADVVTEESELVRDAVFDCDWFAASASFKRSMRIMMARSNQPLVLRAAAFVPLTQETFLRIMNMAYSLYTAMSTVVLE